MIIGMDLCSTIFNLGGPRNQITVLVHAHLHEQHFSFFFIGVEPLVVKFLACHGGGPRDDIPRVSDCGLFGR
jgi:hypothetical protein